MLLLGVLSGVLIAGAGCTGLYVLGIQRGMVGVGLTPGLGVALLAVLSIWALQFGLPESVTGVLLLAVCLAGPALALREWLTRLGVSRDGLALGIMLAALLIPVVVLAQTAFVRYGVPDFIDDGATHAELVDRLRQGGRLGGLDWYPAGFHAPAAALLSLDPTLDSASGSVGWAVGLTLVAPLAIFGFGAALWREPRTAAAGALVLALSLAFPYEPQLYSVWPMAGGVLLVLGLWTTALEYVARPDPRAVLLGGVLAGGLLLVHGTEVYTSAIGLAALALSHLKVVGSRRTAAHVGLALALGLLCAAPYLPTLSTWAVTGGAVNVGSAYFDFRQSLKTDALNEALFWTSAVSSGLLVDVPARLILLGLGAAIALGQHRGRLLVVLGILFAGLVAMFRYLDAEPVRSLYALTLPWAVDDRLLMTVPLLAAPLSGLGLVSVVQTLASRSQRANARRRGWRSGAVVLGIAAGLASVALVADKLEIQTNQVVTYSSDDAIALSWLREHAQPGDVLMNDGAADAGRWAAYKANVSVVLPRSVVLSADGRELLLRANVGHLESRADVRAAACALHVRYVYRGAASSPTALRQFPSLDELRGNSALEEIFHSGEAAIFRTRFSCVPS